MERRSAPAARRCVAKLCRRACGEAWRVDAGEADGAVEDPPDAPVGQPSPARSGKGRRRPSASSAAGAPSGTPGARRPPSRRTGRSAPSAPSRASGAGARRGRRRRGRGRPAPRRGGPWRRGAREGPGRAWGAPRLPRAPRRRRPPPSTERVRGGSAPRAASRRRGPDSRRTFPRATGTAKKVRRAERCRPTDVFERPRERRWARYDRTARTSASAAAISASGRLRNSRDRKAAKSPMSRRYAARVWGRRPRSSRRCRSKAAISPGSTLLFCASPFLSVTEAGRRATGPPSPAPDLLGRQNLAPGGHHVPPPRDRPDHPVIGERLLPLSVRQVAGPLLLPSSVSPLPSSPWHLEQFASRAPTARRHGAVRQARGEGRRGRRAVGATTFMRGTSCRDSSGRAPPGR